MWVKPVKAISKYLRTFIFLLLLLKGTFSLKAAYAQSTNGCAVQPVCVAMLKAEAGTTIAAPTGLGFGTSTLTTTANGGITSSVRAVANISLAARIGTVAVWQYWNQATNEQAQNNAAKKYCLAYPNDSQVCAPPFIGGQCPILYNVWRHVAFDGLLPSQPPIFYPNSNYADRFWGPILDTRVNYTQSSYGSYYNASWEILAHGRYWSYGDWSPTPTPVWRGFGGSGPADPKEKTKVFIYEVKPNNPNQLDNCGNPPPLPSLPWKDWPQAKRNTAVGLLTNLDWQGLITSMPKGGILDPGTKINPPIVIPGQETDNPNTLPDESLPKKEPEFFKWPGLPDFDKDGKPDSTDSDDDNDGTSDNNDPQRYNPTIPVATNNSPNPGESAEPSPQDLQKIESIVNSHKNKECVECATEIEEYLRAKNVRGRRIKLDTPKLTPYDDYIIDESFSQTEAIATNGHHEGVAVIINGQEKVFDNHHPNGVPTQQWKNNLDSHSKNVPAGVDFIEKGYRFP